MMSNRKKMLALVVVLALVGALIFWFVQQYNSPENKLNRYVAKMNETCPIDYDNFTRVDSIKLKGGKRITFYSTYITDKQKINKSAADRFIQYKRSLDIVTNTSMDYLKEKMLIIEFVYFDKKKNKLSQVTVEPKDYISAF